MVGRTLAHYRIEAKLGEGGMGVVYKAHDTHLDRPVAIKILPPERVANPERKRRFQQEAKAASSLNHSNIVHIYDIAAADGVVFIAMEFVDGHTLDELIGGKGLKTRDTVKYAAQIADALAAAHARGIVHRDIKPSNMMVNERGQVKVLDFGIAKLLDQAENDPSAATGTAPPRTEEGTIVGSVAYMSPEQAEGRAVDARSDIFSFGSMLFEMVTGKRAFEGETKVAMMSAILHKDPPSVLELSPSAPTELDKIIARCLRKDPARRTQHMIDLKLALDEVNDDASASAGLARAAAGRSSWRLAGAAAAAVAVIIGLLGWRAGRPIAPDTPLRAIPLTTLPGIERYPSLSPDGSQVAFMWTGPRQDNPDIYVQLIGSGAPLRLTSDARSEYNPVWSPDGKWIAFLRAEQLPLPSGPAGKVEVWLVPPLGGPERKLTAIALGMVGSPAFLAWCPDSTCLVMPNAPAEGKPDSLYVFSRETGESRQLTHPEAPLLGDSNPAISSDGGWLVFRRVAAASAGELHALRLAAGFTAAGKPTRITPAELDAAFPAWLPSTNEILFSGRGSLWRLAIPAEAPPIRIPFIGEDGSMPTITGGSARTPARLVYVRSHVDANIWRIDIPGPGKPGRLSDAVTIGSTRMDILGDLSPDGTRIAFMSDRSGAPEIWLAEANGSNPIQLTAMGGPRTATPRWSPDGKLIAFQSSIEGQYEIYTIPSDGGKARRITTHAANDHVPSFSHDGRSIFFSSLRTGDYEIWKVPVSGGEATQVTKDGGFVTLEPTNSADLYYTEAPGTTTLWRKPASGGERIKVADRVTIGAAAVAVNTGIYFVVGFRGQTQLQFYDFATAKTATVLRNLGDVIAFVAASRDGRTVFISRVDSSANDLMLVEHFK